MWLIHSCSQVPIVVAVVTSVSAAAESSLLVVMNTRRDSCSIDEILVSQTDLPRE